MWQSDVENPKQLRNNLPMAHIILSIPECNPVY